MMNKPSKEVLHVFGKILYSLAMADGKIQEAELRTLRKLVAKNEWAKEIEFSFTEAMEHNMDPHISFLKNMRIFSSRELNQHFPFFLALMESLAEAHKGMSPAEVSLIEEFKIYCSKDSYEVQEGREAKPEEALQVPVI